MENEQKTTNETQQPAAPAASEAKAAPAAAEKAFTAPKFSAPADPRQARGGQQQRGRRGSRNQSAYKKSLTEKQTLKRWYGLSEKQFKRYVEETLEKMGKVDDVANELVRRLERRLDNVVYRMGVAKTRAMARQMVSHGYFLVNGKPVNIASYQVTKNDVIALKENKKKKLIFNTLADDMKNREIPSWLKVEKQALTAKAVGEPSLQEVRPPAEIPMIFEFYSR